MDDADRAFVATLMPDDGVFTAMIAIVTYLDDQGAPRIKVYVDGDDTIAANLGYLEIAKEHLLRANWPDMDKDRP